MENKKIAVIGLDGANPETVEKLVKEERMPNFAALKDKGSGGKLKTTNVSQSPVAWSTFQTGMNPGKHGIFDFIIRNAKTMQLDIGLANERVDEKGNSHYSKRIKKPAIWHYLGKKGFRSIALFIPVTFPAEKISGVQVSGMGLPDLRGTQGLPTLYTTSEQEAEKEDRVLLEYSERIETKITGPREQIQLTIKPLEESIEIEVQGKRIELKKGQWSNFLELDFSGTKGMARFKLLEYEGKRIKLYLSPIMRSQLNPDVPIAYPEKLSKELMTECGCYKPLSFESDVHALKEEMINEKTWLEDMRYTFEQRIKTAKHLLENNKWNFFAIDLFPVDRVQHLFWRYVDKKHPLFEESEYETKINETYELADKKIGELLESLGEETLVFLISDHGFASYRKAVELNKILAQEGFLKMESGETGSFFSVDWSKTEAYALGFSSIYLNRQGREKYGIVSEKDAEGIIENIRLALKKYSFDGEKPFEELHKSMDFYSLESADLPDMIPIYKKGYRSAKASTIGAVPALDSIHDNLNKWSGDHIGPFEESTLPGIIYCSEDLGLKEARIVDLAPTVLQFFDIEKPKEMDGKSLLEA